MAYATPNNAGATQHGELKPEFIRPKDVPRYFGMGRTAVYELIAANKIRSVSMRKRGQRHGTRLISYDSLKNYLESLATGGES
jgi:hypothetical protein